MTHSARILASLSAILMAAQAHALDCNKYIGGTPTAIVINETCAASVGVPPIYVQVGAFDPFEILIPVSTGGTHEYQQEASRLWMSTETHRSAVIEQIENAADASSSAYEVVMEQESAIEYINYALGAWLKSSGAKDEIDALASAPTLAMEGGCSSIPICSSCKNYVCGNVGPWKYCDCHVWGNSCCVISMQRTDE